MKKFRLLVSLFFTMMKIGAFTFGGGYAMIALFEREFVEKKKWLTHEEFIDLVAIAESTPGPIAINCSTYIGYKKAKILGAVVSTVGMCIPSFVIIYVISLFFRDVLTVKLVAAAFKGIQACVIFLILSAGIRLLKSIKVTPFNIVVFIATFLAMVAFFIFGVGFSSIFFILISGCAGLLVYLIGAARKKSAERKEDEK